jgi:L-lactate utilization protein LutC
MLASSPVFPFPQHRSPSMSNIIDVLEQSLVQKFPVALLESSEQFTEQLHKSLADVSDIELYNAIRQFCDNMNAEDAVHALDLKHSFADLLDSADKIKHEDFMSDITKLVALCLAYETDSLTQLDIFQPLQDYPV